MIKNEKQYKITKSKLGDIKDKIAEMRSREHSLSTGKQLILASLQHLKAQMQIELEDYETLKNSETNILKSRSISELPSLIIEYKIASGLTQKEFSKVLGLKEQQLQRYEAESFKSISFKNLMKIFQIIGLDIKTKDMRLNRSSNPRQDPNATLA